MTMDPSLKHEEQAILRLRSLYRSYGYTHYKMSKFEEYDLYVRNKSFLVSENILTFTDTDGKLMALKPDVTLSIIKNVKEGSTALEKVYYNENVYRTSPTSHGFQEIMQAGLECIGDLDLYAISEVVLLAARSLESISEAYLLDLSHLGFVTGLLNQLGLRESALRELLGYLGAKNTSAITAACGRYGVSPQHREQLCRLALLYGTPEEVLPELKKMAAGPQMERALAELKEICSLLSPGGYCLRLDFSIVNDKNYYNGLVFRGFLPGLPSSILAGGQYDNLLHRMGKRGGAIGFAVYLDLLERFGGEELAYDVDVLLLYDRGISPAEVAAEVAAIEGSGQSVRAERAIPEGLKYRHVKEVH